MMLWYASSPRHMYGPAEPGAGGSVAGKFSRLPLSHRPGFVASSSLHSAASWSLVGARYLSFVWGLISFGLSGSSADVQRTSS
jgi:hypothetical protein